MKVTALIPDTLVRDVRRLTAGSNITESLITALGSWVSHQKLKRARDRLRTRPLSFKRNVTAKSLRELNRRT
jgi:hypothetical protein